MRLWSSVAHPGTSESQTTAEGGTRLMATPKALRSIQPWKGRLHVVQAGGDMGGFGGRAAGSYEHPRHRLGVQWHGRLLVLLRSSSRSR